MKHDNLQDFIKPFLPRSVLLLGMHLRDNQYTRYLEKKWLHVEHLHGNSSIISKIPDCDSMVIATDQIGHVHYDDVKDYYKKHKRPFWTTKNGMSQIKKDFEDKIFGPGVLEKLKSDEMPLELKIAYCLIRFHTPGDIISSKEFKIRMAQLLDISVDDIPKNSVGNVFLKMKKPGMRILTLLKTKNKAQAKYKYYGLRGLYNEQFEEWDLWIPQEAPLSWTVEDEALVVSDDDELYQHHIPEVALNEAEEEQPLEDSPEDEILLQEEEVLELKQQESNSLERESPVVAQTEEKKAEETPKQQSSMDELFFEALHANTKILHDIEDKIQTLHLDVLKLSEMQAVEKPAQPVTFNEGFVASIVSSVTIALQKEVQQIKLEFLTREESLRKKLALDLNQALAHNKELDRLSPFVARLSPDQLRTFNSMLQVFAGQSLPAFEAVETATLDSQPH